MIKKLLVAAVLALLAVGHPRPALADDTTVTSDSKGGNGNGNNGNGNGNGGPNTPAHPPGRR